MPPPERPRLLRCARTRRPLRRLARGAARRAAARDQDPGGLWARRQAVPGVPDERFGAPADVADFTGLLPATCAGFLAHRRAEEIDPRSLQRALSALRSLARYLERIGAGRASAFSALRSPRAGRRSEAAPRSPTPRPFRRPTSATARRAIPGFSRAMPPCWRCATARACASARRFRSARRDAPIGEIDQLTIIGKGGKTRVAPVIAPVRAAIEAYLAHAPIR